MVILLPRLSLRISCTFCSSSEGFCSSSKNNSDPVSSWSSLLVMTKLPLSLPWVLFLIRRLSGIILSVDTGGEGVLSG